MRLNLVIGRYLFDEPIRCFLNPKKKRKGGQNTENISREKKTKKSRKPLKQELQLYREQGVALYLDGEPSSPKRIARACTVAEGGVYMRDYTEDEAGRIARVDFDFIENSSS